MKISFDKHFIENNNGNFQIKLKEKVEIPKNLYKYYSLNKFSLESVKNKTFHFSHSFTMNDLMDGNFLLWDMEDFLNKFIEDKKLPKEIKKELHKNFLIKFSDEFLKYIGIFCASENYSNDLLWSHYTNEQGFCIEINVQNFIDSLKNFTFHYFPIHYGELKQINIFKYGNLKKENFTKTMDLLLPIYYSLSMKEIFWNYENEWRFIIKNENFDKITNPLVLITQEQKNFEINALEKRNIKITDSVIEKVILSTVFFNNKRFSYNEFDKMKVKYYFENNNEKNVLQEFLTILKKEYNDKIFQIDKFLINGKVIREIQFKLEILEINDTYVEVQRL